MMLTWVFLLKVTVLFVLLMLVTVVGCGIVITQYFEQKQNYSVKWFTMASVFVDRLTKDKDTQGKEDKDG